eukprot:2675504-Amphidinium_carterae.1
MQLWEQERMRREENRQHAEEKRRQTEMKRMLLEEERQRRYEEDLRVPHVDTSQILAHETCCQGTTAGHRIQDVQRVR